MSRIASLLALVLSTLTLALAVPGCGGPRAALSATVFPGDTLVTGRRLESLARQFERDYGCTEADTITVSGLAPGVYNVDGCAHTRDYQLQCRPGAYGQICEWVAFEDLSVHAGRDFSCDPAALDIQVMSPNTRSVSGCGFRAVYMMQCAGSCAWILAGRIEADTGAAGGGNAPGGGYTY